MSIESRKLSFIQEFLTINNEDSLSRLESILKMEKSKDEIVGLTVDGKPLNKEAYIRNLDEARNQIKEGKFLSQEELEKQSENW